MAPKKNAGDRASACLRGRPARREGPAPCWCVPGRGRRTASQAGAKQPGGRCLAAKGIWGWPCAQCAPAPGRRRGRRGDLPAADDGSTAWCSVDGGLGQGPQLAWSPSSSRRWLPTLPIRPQVDEALLVGYRSFSSRRRARRGGAVAEWAGGRCRARAPAARSCARNPAPGGLHERGRA